MMVRKARNGAGTEKQVMIVGSKGDDACNHEEGCPAEIHGTHGEHGLLVSFQKPSESMANGPSKVDSHRMVERRRRAESEVDHRVLLAVHVALCWKERSFKANGAIAKPTSSFQADEGCKVDIRPD